MKTGYDIGGAEYPFDPEHLTVVDVLKPMEPADWFKRDLNVPSWTDGLNRRQTIYIGKTLRYLTYRKEFAAELDNILTEDGTITIFDELCYIEPILVGLIRLGYVVTEIELINVGAAEDEVAAEWQTTITRRSRNNG